MGRTRVLGEDLIEALERADEVLESHNEDKQQKWKLQSWQEHLRRAIIHLTNALMDSEDGTEIEAAHGTVRALMGLAMIRKSGAVVHRWCREHVEKKPPLLLKQQVGPVVRTFVGGLPSVDRSTDRRSLP